MKTEMLKLRLSEAEKRSFQEAADLAGITISAWVRERLRSAAVRELEGAGRPVPFIQPISTRDRFDG